MWNNKKRHIRAHLKNIHKACMQTETFEPENPRHFCGCHSASHANFNPTYSSRGSCTGSLTFQTHPSTPSQSPGHSQSQDLQRPRTTATTLQQPSLAYGMEPATNLPQPRQRPQTSVSVMLSPPIQQMHRRRRKLTPCSPVSLGKYKWEEQSRLINHQVAHKKQLLNNRQYLIKPLVKPEYKNPIYHPAYTQPHHHNPFPLFSPDRRDPEALTADLLLLTKHRSTSNTLYNKASGGFKPTRYLYDDSMGGARMVAHVPGPTPLGTRLSTIEREQRQQRQQRAEKQQQQQQHYQQQHGNATVKLSYSEWNVQHPAFPANKSGRQECQSALGRSRSSLSRNGSSLRRSGSDLSESRRRGNRSHLPGGNRIDYRSVRQTREGSYRTMTQKKERNKMRTVRQHRTEMKSRGETIFGIGFQ